MSSESKAASRPLPGVNAGYQQDDIDIVDYGLWQIGDQQARGPRPDLSLPYGVALGAAQVFGRFVPRPFPAQVGEALGIQMLNLGFSGSGPSFFLQRPELIEAINGARFAIVHMMSGRSVNNSRLLLAKNQGVAFSRDRPDEPARFAEDAYAALLRELPMSELATLRGETRVNYVAEMDALLARITVPKILLYWSQRTPEYAEGLGALPRYWADFPHFVNRGMIDRLAPLADGYVEQVGARGMPQRLVHHTTGAPVIAFPADRFPSNRLRDHNNYYPSPEMHDDVARALMPHVRTLVDQTTESWQRHPPAASRRRLLVHLDIFGNASSTVIRSLRESFGAAFRDDLSAERLPGQVAAAPAIEALSSGSWRFEDGDAIDADVRTLVLLRHPLLRARALYAIERGAERQRHSHGLHTRRAAESSLAEWIEWCLSDGDRAAPVSNFQTRACSRTRTGRSRGDWALPMTVSNFEEAHASLAGASVGIVEDLVGSLTRIEAELRHELPALRLLAYDERSTRASDAEITEQLADFCAEIGELLFERLTVANSFDLLLYRKMRRDI